MLDTVTVTSDLAPSPAPTMGSLVDRDEYGPITGRPGGLFTAAAPVRLGDCDDLGRRLAGWVPADHLF